MQRPAPVTGAQQSYVAPEDLPRPSYFHPNPQHGTQLATGNVANAIQAAPWHVPSSLPAPPSDAAWTPQQNR